MLPAAAHAHAIILDSMPAANAALTGNDLSIRLHYNSRIDHARSKLTLFGPDNTPQPVTLDSDAPTDLLTASVHSLTPGAWRLRWQVLSVDGHITRGDIPFTVN